MYKITLLLVPYSLSLHRKTQDRRERIHFNKKSLPALSNRKGLLLKERFIVNNRERPLYFVRVSDEPSLVNQYVPRFQKLREAIP